MSTEVERLVDRPRKTVQNKDSIKFSATEGNLLTSPRGIRGEVHMCWYLREQFRLKDKIVGGSESPFPCGNGQPFFYKSPFQRCFRGGWLTTHLVPGMTSRGMDSCSDG